jgi:hypothetical protein
MYRSKYPGADVVSDVFKEKMSQILTERNKSDEMRNIVIARNKSKAMRDFISERNKDPEFKLKVKKGMQNPELKKKQAERLAKRNRESWKDPEYRARHTEIARETQRKRNSDPEVIAKKSKMFRDLWKDPEISKRMLNSYKSSPFGRSCRYKEYYCRSQGELELLVSLEEIGASNILMENLRIPYELDGVIRTYIPDFTCELNGVNYVIEQKYSESSDMYPEKVEGALKYCDDNGYVFCWVRRFKETPKILATKSLDCSIVRSK